MILLRKILFPFAILYGLITWFRNFLFDEGILRSYTFDLPVIAVGNLSVGGTGKTPQIEYLIRLLSNEYKVATLSRGYKRKSDGFILANPNVSALTIGDEPYQYYTKFDNIQVAVDADRKHGINQLLSLSQKPDVILLDDAFQHRRVMAGLYILLTAYGDLYCDDGMLPAGNLREYKSGAKRADMVIVTKCPADISQKEQQQIKKRLRLNDNQELYFTTITYESKIIGEKKVLDVSELRNRKKILVAGIAKPEPFFDFLKNPDDPFFAFPDHHEFSSNEILEIKKIAKDDIIITTEKDYTRLKGSFPSDQLFYLPMQSSFIIDGEYSGNDFDKNILNYVGASTRYR